MSLMAKTVPATTTAISISRINHQSLSSRNFFFPSPNPNPNPNPICFSFRYLHPNVAFKRSRNLPQIKAQSFPDYIPDSKFYKVEAILRPWRIEKVSLALLKMGIRGVTISDVRGFGAQGGVAERHAGSEFSEDKFVTKVKLEIVLSKDQVESVIDLIIQEARTGEIGDGKIFVLPVADVIRVRTGERGEQAERMSGGWYDMSTIN